MRYRGWMSRAALAIFVVAFVGARLPRHAARRGLYVVLARIFAALYFAFFLLMPIYTKLDPVKPVPERVVYHAH